MSNKPTTTLDVDTLAQEIRRVDGNHSLGAGKLAEALLPSLSASRPAPEVVKPMTLAETTKLREIEEILTCYLVDNTDEVYEELPEIDNARTLVLELLGDL